MSERPRISQKDGISALKAIQRSKDGCLAIEFIFQELMYGQELAASDPRQQERNVALHDLAARLDKQMRE